MFKVDNKNIKTTSHRTMISIKLVCNFIEITIWHDLVLDMTSQFDMTSRVGMMLAIYSKCWQTLCYAYN